jgi:micrococcal nuclease
MSARGVSITAVVVKARSKAVGDGFYGGLLLAGLVLLALVGVRCSYAVDSPPYTAIRVYDGDTIRVQGSSGRETIRLLGIDAPETPKGKGKPGQPYSRKSQHYLADLVLNRTVTLKVYGRDRYDRILAVVYCSGREVNRAMLAAGLAEVYRGRTPEAFDKAPYLETEAHARRSKIGMWRQGDAYVSPIRWKHPR